ncbi:conserved hypothetical protein (plasmid) [Rhodococcus jostii RHA1]|uniref:SnoaL-like domain-containing protein n=1 Tax=Rhodococcus jostii (strain RHA1) TaxID=101510 RepID=Q0RX92_RHOJR|nr:hypothetical protein [Rhodococcus jostii]ABH00094.1 conserved hypothetical protein [Rhodococcus jostii RHA1]
MAKWWFHYDEWNPVELRSLMTDDFAFTCRSDTGATDYEDFIRCDIRRVDAVMAWKEDHRANSPYPLRHNGANFVITDDRERDVDFSSYIFVTKIVHGRPVSLSTGITSGTARRTPTGMLLERVETVLDTQDSVRYADAQAATAPRS